MAKMPKIDNIVCHEGSAEMFKIEDALKLNISDRDKQTIEELKNKLNSLASNANIQPATTSQQLAKNEPTIKGSIITDNQKLLYEKIKNDNERVSKHLIDNNFDKMNSSIMKSIHTNNSPQIKNEIKEFNLFITNLMTEMKITQKSDAFKPIASKIKPIILALKNKKEYDNEINLLQKLIEIKYGGKSKKNRKPRKKSRKQTRRYRKSKK